MTKLKFEITYLKWNGKRKTVTTKAKSLPAAIEKVRRKADKDIITWYTLVNAKRIER
jgi:hypothetical protein